MQYENHETLVPVERLLGVLIFFNDEVFSIEFRHSCMSSLLQTRHMQKKAQKLSHEICSC
jgi:hypothetical protein